MEKVSRASSHEPLCKLTFIRVFATVQPAVDTDLHRLFVASSKLEGAYKVFDGSASCMITRNAGYKYDEGKINYKGGRQSSNHSVAVWLFLKLIGQDQIRIRREGRLVLAIPFRLIRLSRFQSVPFRLFVQSSETHPHTHT